MGYKTNWKGCDERTAQALISGANNPGKVFEFDAQYLPGGIASGMRNVQKMFVSGMCEPKAIAPDAEIAGEMAAIRYQGGDGIAYRWLFALSGKKEEPTVLYGCFYKRCDDHHFESGVAVPIQSIFKKPNPYLWD